MSCFNNYIDGQWVWSEGRRSNINPSDTNDVVGDFADGEVEDVQRAAVAARRAFGVWSTMAAQARSDILSRIADALKREHVRLGELMAREEGRTLPEAKGEILRAAQIFTFFSGEIMRQSADLVPSVRVNAEVIVSREPLGVVGLITPWNVPMALPAWKIAPALAFGNCVVFKPAELVPACAWELTRIISEAGVPPGVFNLVMGKGTSVGAAMVSSPEIDAISFTGSVATGRSIGTAAFATGKKIQLEMGGKNPLVVLDDADIETAVNCAIDGSFFWTGQRCTASSRLVVTKGIHDLFVDRMKDRMLQLRVDHAMKHGTQIGPVIDSGQLERNLNYVEIARKEGGKVVGGERLSRDTPGHYMSPALITETTNDMRINREEVFGPVASVIKVQDYEEALTVANDTIFGLSSGICTTSLKHATHFRRHAESGIVAVNLPTAGVDYHVAFGGRKGSSYGPREQGRHAVEFFTNVKTAYVSS